MRTEELTLGTLHRLSEGLTSDFTQQLQAAVEDCRQRPALAEMRTITIKLEVAPHPEDPEDVIIRPVTTRKMPARKIDPIRARRTMHNQLQFDWVDEGDIQA